jgi:hypothetical protein
MKNDPANGLVVDERGAPLRYDDDYIRTNHVEDGTHYGIVIWGKHSFNDAQEFGLFRSEHDAREARDAFAWKNPKIGSAGLKTIRITVHQGKITTRRILPRP